MLDFNTSRTEAINKIFYSREEGFGFNDDLENFTFFNKKLLQIIRQDGIDLAAENGIDEYKECFLEEDIRPVHFVELSPEILTKHDLVHVRDYLNAK